MPIHSHVARRAPRQALLCLMIATALAQAHAAEPTPASAGATTAIAAMAPTRLDAVVVTGTRGVARTVDGSEAPIDVLSAEDIGRANKSNLLDVLNTALPSFNLPLETGDLNSMVRAGQLRGLNASHTLVLVNGKRWHSTALLGAGGFGAAAPVDLGLIPNAAIKRIEVLRDGASAIYGSDAIAGVVNIITEDDPGGGAVSYRDGRHFEGDGRNRTFQAGAGLAVGDGGHLRLSAQYDDQEATNRTGPARSSFLYYFPLDAQGNEILPAGSLSSNPQLPAGATPNPKEATRDDYAWKNRGIRAFELKSVAADFGLPLSQYTELYGLALYSRRDAKAPQNFRHPARDEVVRAIFPDGYAPWEELGEEDVGVTAGIKGGTESGWSWDLSSNYGRDRVDIDLHNSLNPTYGLDSQTRFYVGRLRYSALTSNFDLRRGFDVGWLAQPLQLSLGAERRDENYRVGAGDEQSWSHGGQPVLDGPNAGKALGRGLGGAQALPGFKPGEEVDEDRRSISLYAGVSLNPTSKWLVDLAARHEDYSDFGSEITGRLSTRYDFNERFAVRATASTGFQAPSLAAQSHRRTVNGNYSTTHTLKVDSPEAIALGARPLEPETSVNYGIGLVLEPFAGWNLALDLYRIEVEDRIAQSTTFSESSYPGAGALVEAAGFGRDDGITYFINAADTRTEGVELTLETDSDLGRYGSIRWSLAAHHNRARIRDIVRTPDVLAELDIPVFSRGSQNDLLYKAPRSKQVLNANWSLGGFNLNLRQTHYGAIQRWGTPNPVPATGPYAGQAEIAYSIGDTWLTDIEASYRFAGGLRLALAASNVFDEKAIKYPEPLTPSNMEYYYATGGPIDASGGFWAATVEYQW
ncbi:TonB-dependent receptor [Pseudoxanthomonas broegbernensis]|uniref:TonB-dependent receptor n=1 Tax=Pseudoxanthomonas broegbernensis TaxID=83619 RepID=A0A7V8GN99_9GAMM|nr:TonB-dependent receptor [Pseudoxanthomonas broegbernensis]KAF1686981.1 TonB-dependent receptor [Pseudoxanthomonas broegbernensis]MBB6065407.1 iron complex outermembrane receptor protein [Pseudoxanthomonas broegbernensis]